MVARISTLKGIVKTIRTTYNFWVDFSFQSSNEKKRIFFRNGTSFFLTWPEYWKIRDVISAGYGVSQLGDDLFQIQKVPVTLVGSSEMLKSISEGSGFYDFDCVDKTVLDIGGFQGESAVIFSSMGAKKVIIYEPVPNHQETIKKNVLLNHVNAELHEEGIGNSDSFETINYTSTDLGFGHGSNGSNQLKIRLRNITRIIDESGADVAKFNCEGAEESLVCVPPEVLRKINIYIIMAHSPEISNAIIRKFNSSGFSLIRKNSARSFLYFKRESFPA
jgi:FkbM family methyltransferase